MNTYKVDTLGVDNLADKIISLIEKEQKVYIEGLGQVDIDNVELVCNTIKLMQKLNPTKKAKKPYKKRTIEQDMTIVEYMKNHTIKETGKMFDLPLSTVNNIRKKYNMTKSRKCS